MVLLRQNIKWYKENNATGEYSEALDRYTEMYNDYLKEYLSQQQ